MKSIPIQIFCIQNGIDISKLDVELKSACTCFPMYLFQFKKKKKEKKTTKQKLHLMLRYSFLRGQESLAKTHQKYL